MTRRRTASGQAIQGETQAWEPLLKAVGAEVTGQFMWMFEVALSDGTAVHAYKHIDTRGYIHLAPDGRAFVYEPPDRYRQYPAAEILAAVFATLPGLSGVTDAQIRACWSAVDRLERGSRPQMTRSDPAGLGDDDREPALA